MLLNCQYKRNEMEGQELFESICKQADNCKKDKDKLNELWVVLKTNRARMSEVEFSFAAEHIGKYFEECEAREDGINFEKHTSSD